MLARNVGFVDTDRPSGLAILNWMPLFIHDILRGDSIFFDIALPKEKSSTGFWTQDKRILPLGTLQIS